jgi:hypothetical protein
MNIATFFTLSYLLTMPIINILGPQIMPGVQQQTRKRSENPLHPDDEDNDGSHVGFFLTI